MENLKSLLGLVSPTTHSTFYVVDENQVVVYMPWIRVSCSVDKDVVEPLSKALENLNVNSISLQGSKDQEIYEPDPECTPFWQDVQIVVLMSLEEPLADVRSTLNHFGGRDFTVNLLPDTTWEDAWRQKSQTKRIGNLIVSPLESDCDPNLTSIQLVPGLAFGTGDHPTTAMSLTWLQQLSLEGKTVLDFGCGSGILAIAAKKLGAKRVVAVDHDPQAISSAESNAERNQVSIDSSKVIPADSKFDVVVANILLNTLVSHANELENCLVFDGAIGLTGLLSNQQESIREAYANIRFLTIDTLDHWIFVGGRKCNSD